MSLKDQIARDNRTLFFSLDEFGSAHTLAGREVTGLLDVDQAQAGRFAAAFGDLSYCTFYALESDLEGLSLQVGRTITLDQRLYIIQQVSHEEGIVLLTLSIPRGY